MTMARAVAAMPMKEMSKGVETCLEKLGFVAMLSIFLASSVGISSALDRVGLGLLASFVISLGFYWVCMCVVVPYGTVTTP